MDKRLLVYVLMGTGFLYGFSWVIKSVQEENAHHNAKFIEYKTYQSTDSVGQVVLHISDLEEAKQIDVWNASMLREEWVELFPNFAEMKLFVADRVEESYLKKRLNMQIDSTESSYLSGHIAVDTAKRMLAVLK